MEGRYSNDHISDRGAVARALGHKGCSGLGRFEMNHPSCGLLRSKPVPGLRNRGRGGVIHITVPVAGTEIGIGARVGYVLNLGQISYHLLLLQLR